MKESNSGYSDLLEEHSIEGLEILQGTSSIIAHALIYIVLLMLLCFLGWSFFTKADVIITVPGKLSERTESKRIYVPVAGELIELFVSEGMLVAKGDLLARIRSPAAIQIAGAAAQAKLAMEDTALVKDRFPAQKKLLERELDSMLQAMQLLEKDYNRQKKEGLRQLSGSQKRQLEMLRIQLSEKEDTWKQAKALLEKYNRLFNTPGSGGISRKELMGKENEVKRAEAAYRQTYSQLDDLELTFSQQYLANSQKIEQLRLQIIQSQLQYDQRKNQIDRMENEVNMKYLAAVESWKVASKVNFSDLDDNNFLVIRAPVSGEVSAVWYRQAGEKIRPSTPLLAISPKNADKALRLSIPDKDRAMLAVGQPVKIKFHAFPYQRFGFLSGELKFLSNSAEVTKEGRSLYKGRVKLDKDYYQVNGRQFPVRFGMNANVEIVVQRRRVLDFALDPFRKLVQK